MHSVIIDIRGNYGGWPRVSSGLFHYIHESYFKTMAKSSMLVSNAYRSFYTDKYPELNNINFVFPARRHYVDLEKVLKSTIGSYINEDLFFNETPVTKEYEFTGDCYLLIDRKSYSASSSFASAFQCYTMGYIIGETTGGTKIFRANAFVRKMVRTGFVVRVSSTKLFTACYDEEDQGVTPNIEVIPTVLDIIHNADPQLQTALLLIKKMQASKAQNSNKEN